MMKLKSYKDFVNENLIGQYSYYGQGSLFPLVNKLASEGKTLAEVERFLNIIGVDKERQSKVLIEIFGDVNNIPEIDETLKEDEISKENEILEEDEISNK